MYVDILVQTCYFCLILMNVHWVPHLFYLGCHPIISLPQPALDFPASPHACPQRQGHPVPSQHPATVAPWLHLQTPEALGVYPIVKLQFIITWGSFRVGLYILGDPQLLGKAFKNNAPRNFHLHNSLLNLEQTSPT